MFRECDVLLLYNYLHDLRIDPRNTYVISPNTSANHPIRNVIGTYRCLLNEPSIYSPNIFNATKVDLNTFRSKLIHHVSLLLNKNIGLY